MGVRWIAGLRIVLLAMLLVGEAHLLAGCSMGSSPSGGTSAQASGGLTGNLTGRVIDVASQDEVQGAEVRVMGQLTTTDWVGRYAFSDILEGIRPVTVTCSGYLPYTGTVTVVPQTTTTQDIYISPPSRVTGTITDGMTNSPLRGVAVILGTSTATSDADGRYTLEMVPAGTQSVTASKLGYIGGEAVLHVPRDETVTQDFVIYPTGATGTVRGVVTDALAGVVIAGVRVVIGNASTTTGDQGNYTLAGAPAGTQVLVATQPGYNTYRSTVNVPYLQALTHSFEMAQPGTTGTVEGNILDMNSGAALKDATVSIGSRSAVTSASGKFSIPNVPVGTQAIGVTRSGYISHSDTVLVEPDAVDNKYMTISKTPLRKGPYLLYNNDTTTMTVLWQTYSKPNDAKIEWGPTTAYSSSATVTENSNAMNEHRFSHTIQGLAADTRIHYKVTVDGQSATGSFRTAPDPTTTTLSFYSYGDTRANHALWETVNDHDAVCQAIMADMQADTRRQTLILHDGDIVRHGLDEAYWDTQYFMRAYPHQVALESTLPIMGSIGNHECYQSNCDNLDLQQGGALLRKYWPYATYPRSDRFYQSFDYGPMHFAVVDTWMHPDYTPGTDQYQWLAQDLANTTRPWKVVFMHTPPWDCNVVDQGLINGLTPLFKQQGVKVVIAGHVHHYCRTVVDGITYLALGGGGAPLDTIANPYNPLSQPYVQRAESTFHFARLDVAGNTITVTVIRSDGTVLETFPITQ